MVINEEVVRSEPVWSFSRVNAYVTCPRMYYLTYEMKLPRADNAFALYGTHCHEVLERFYNGELDSWSLLIAFQEGYDEAITVDFPPNKWKDLRQSYFDAGEIYFAQIEDLPDDVEVLGVEKNFEIEIGNHKLKGFIDLVLRDKTTGDITIIDHKSRAAFKNKDDLNHYLIQPYLYSEAIYQEYGVYPKKLAFNMFRILDYVEEEFQPEKRDASIEWFESVIRQIESDEEFRDKIAIDYEARGKDISTYTNSDFFCNYLCSVRDFCNRSGI